MGASQQGAILMRIFSPKTIEQSLMEIVTIWARSRSKDPSTKVGAAIYDPVNGGTYLGYNGFPAGLPDLDSWWEDREVKARLVVHAEVNAAHKALQSGADLKRCWLVCTHLPCERCMTEVVSSLGIKRIIWSRDDYKSCTDTTREHAKFLAEQLQITMERIEP